MNTNSIPFDFKEAMDMLYGIEPEQFSAFIQSKDVRRKAKKSELKKIPGEKKIYHSFGSLKKINF